MILLPSLQKICNYNIDSIDSLVTAPFGSDGKLSLFRSVWRYRVRRISKFKLTNGIFSELILLVKGENAIKQMTGYMSKMEA